MEYIEAKRVAESLMEQFRPICERIDIQGTLRRMESEINKINLLVLPKQGMGLQDLLIPSDQYIEKMLVEMRDSGVINYEKITERSKQFWLITPGISVQLYLVLPPATWGVRHVFGTGPEDFARWMVTRKKSGGALPDHCRVKEGAVWDRETGQKYDTPEEMDFFTLCGLDWIDPQARIAQWTNRRRS